MPKTGSIRAASISFGQPPGHFGQGRGIASTAWASCLSSRADSLSVTDRKYPLVPPPRGRGNSRHRPPMPQPALAVHEWCGQVPGRFGTSAPTAAAPRGLHWVLPRHVDARIRRVHRRTFPQHCCARSRRRRPGRAHRADVPVDLRRRGLGAQWFFLVVLTLPFAVLAWRAARGRRDRCRRACGGHRPTSANGKAAGASAPSRTLTSTSSS